jgi:cyclic-di-GMP-binding protein
MPDNSFDIVSRIDLAEVSNAVQQARKELFQRFDLKGSGSEIELKEKERELHLTSSDEFKLKNVIEILEQKLVKRQVPLKGFSYGPVTPAASSTVRQVVKIQEGIPVEKGREIVKAIKNAGLKKVQASIQGDVVRVSGKNRDDLQQVIALLKDEDFGIDMQFTNYRTN